MRGTWAAVMVFVLVSAPNSQLRVFIKALLRSFRPSRRLSPCSEPKTSVPPPGPHLGGGDPGGRSPGRPRTLPPLAARWRRAAAVCAERGRWRRPGAWGPSCPPLVPCAPRGSRGRVLPSPDPAAGPPAARTCPEPGGGGGAGERGWVGGGSRPAGAARGHRLPARRAEPGGCGPGPRAPSGAQAPGARGFGGRPPAARSVPRVLSLPPRGAPRSALVPPTHRPFP